MPKPNPLGDVVPIHVMLTASLNNTTGKVEFKPKCPILNVKKHEYIFNKISQGMDKKDYHEIRFKLTDNTGLGLKLPAKLEDAFWVVDCSQGAHRCPDHTDISDYSEFKPVTRADDTTLIVENYNEHEKYWMFSVNFVKQLSTGNYDENDRANYVCYDPGGGNQDYNVKGQGISAATAGAIGLLAGALLTLGVERLL